MNVDRLKALLPEIRDVASLYRNYVAEHGVVDVTAFLANLADKGLLAEDAVRRAIVEVEAGFTLNERGSVAGPPPRRKGPRFRSLSMLGRGAMGEVWLARDRDLNRVVALKRMDASIASDTAMQARFYTEVRITAQLDHPGIVAVYGLEFDADDLPTYAMKVVRGKNLQDLLATSVNAQREGKEVPEEASFRTLLELFVQISHTLAYAADRGVVHRDLKPENIMVGAHHEVIVMDWGIAKLVGDAEAATGEPGAASTGEGTEWGVAIGTPLYMSPEQANGENATLDGRSDQFSLGLILYEICCGKKAYTGKTVPQILLRAADADLDPIGRADGKPIPRELAAVIRRATQRRPEDRYASCAALADDVRRYLRDEPVLAAPDSGVQRAARWVAKNRQLALAIGVALVALVFAVVAGGTLFGIGAVAAQRYAAAEREARLASVIAAVSNQGRQIDGRFLHYMGEVRALGAAAEYALAHEPGDRPPYFTMDYLDPTKRPPDAVESKRYHGWLSVDATDTLLVDARWEDVERVGRQIVGLEPQLERALFESQDPKVRDGTSASRQRLVEDGLPVVWAYYGLENGVIVTYPGTQTAPDAGYDHRTQAWYEVGRRAPTPVWGPAATDETGMGLLMPCVVAIHGPDRQFAGVASMDLSLGYVVDSLLKPRGVSAPTQSYFVNPSGKVVVSTVLDTSKRRQLADMERFPFDAPLAQMLSGSQPSGWQVVRADGRDRMVVWVPLNAIGWWYVVVGDEDELLGGA